MSDFGFRLIRESSTGEHKVLGRFWRKEDAVDLMNELASKEKADVASGAPVFGPISLEDSVGDSISFSYDFGSYGSVASELTTIDFKVEEFAIC